jgi:hypothetical protein
MLKLGAEGALFVNIARASFAKASARQGSGRSTFVCAKLSYKLTASFEHESAHSRQ